MPNHTYIELLKSGKISRTIGTGVEVFKFFDPIDRLYITLAPGKDTTIVKEIDNLKVLDGLWVTNAPMFVIKKMGYLDEILTNRGFWVREPEIGLEMSFDADVYSPW